MRALNRSAIVVRPNLPFLDWLHAVDPTSQALTLDSLTEDQLNGWWRDRATWPTPRSLAFFRSWFDCQFHSMLLDLADASLIEEEI